MASRFWVGGTGTWDSGSTAHWAASSGAGGGQTVPGVSDTVTFDSASGGGTVTVNMTVTVQSITCGSFTGTLDFAANDNNVTLTAASGITFTGAGTRTINMGDGTWTLTAPAQVTNTTPTNLTFNANGSTIVLSGATATARTFAGGGLTYNNVTFAANTSGASITVTGSNTFANLTISGGVTVYLTASLTQTVTNAFTWAGTKGAAFLLSSANDVNNSTISCATGTCTAAFGTFRRVTFAGGATFNLTNCFDLGLNSGATFASPLGPRSGFQLGM